MTNEQMIAALNPARADDDARDFDDAVRRYNDNVRTLATFDDDRIVAILRDADDATRDAIETAADEIDDAAMSRIYNALARVTRA